tara:strand:- start:2482 stop:3789 length:1308 start_codon:yes stop_codon:yes gene_type:complete
MPPSPKRQKTSKSMKMAKLLEMARNKDTCDAVKTMAQGKLMMEGNKKKTKKKKKKKKTESEKEKKEEKKQEEDNRKKRKRGARKVSKMEEEEEETEGGHEGEDAPAWLRLMDGGSNGAGCNVADSEMRRQLESDEVLRSQRNALHAKETKEAAALILEQCKQHLDTCTLDTSEVPGLAVSRCDDFINSMVHQNGMMAHKLDMARKTREFAAEPVKRQWEESFLQEPSGDQCACAKFKLGRCIANELYSSTHGSDFTLREYFTPREAVERQNAAAKKTTTTTTGTGRSIVDDENNDDDDGANNMKKKKKKKKLKTDLGSSRGGTATCLLCRRHDVFSSILVARSKGEQVVPSLVLPDIANFVDVEGEYESSGVVYNLPSRYEGLLDPVVAVNRNYFEPIMHNGLRCLRQVLPYARQRLPSAPVVGNNRDQTNFFFR